MSCFETSSSSSPSSFPFIIITIAALAIAFVPSSRAFAKGGGGGGHMLGIQLGTVSTGQEHMNALISRANTRAGGISTSSMNSAYEGSVQYGYRFSGTIFSLLLRPSYFYQVSKGAGGGADYNYSVTGFNIFPMFRLYPLENEFMRFFMQLGLGYGRANGVVEEAGAKAEFVGDAFGTVIGLGTEFCFTPNYCATLEGNYRYMKMARNIASDVSGTFDTDSLSQATKNQEIEIDNTDFATSMSGLQFLAGFTILF